MDSRGPAEAGFSFPVDSHCRRGSMEMFDKNKPEAETSQAKGFNAIILIV
jgi:hypothetical protein